MKPVQSVIVLLFTIITLATDTQAQTSTIKENQQPKKAAMNQVHNPNKETIRQLFEVALNQRKFELLNKFISPDYAGANLTKGPKAFEAPLLLLIKSLPDIQWNIHELIAEDNKVFVRWTISATHQHTFNDIPATGKQVNSGGMGSFELTNGIVIKSNLLTDRVHFLQQLNVLPADLTTLQRKANPKKVVFIDKFIVPAAAVSEFKERVRINRELLKTIPGFIDDAAYESADSKGLLHFVTVAEWESTEALQKAREAVQASYKKEGFDIAAMMKRLSITLDRAVYQPSVSH